MGDCLRGGGAYKLLREEKRRKKSTKARKIGRKERERKRERKRETEKVEVTSLSSQDIQSHSASRGKKETYNSVGRIPLGI